MNSLVTYLKNVRTELSHVVWPRPSTAAIHVALIVFITVIVALLIAGLDYGFSAVIQRVVETR